MKGKTAILVLGVSLILLSYLLYWYSEGGNATRLALDDYRVRAALDAIATDPSNAVIATRGEPQKAWVNDHSRGYRVSVIVLLHKYPWHASVVFSTDGVPLETAVQLTGGLPVYTRRLGYALVGLWLVAGILSPRIFGRKCPQCHKSFWNPVYLDTEDTLVYPGGWDDKAYALSAIIRSDFICRRCGYRKVTYSTQPPYRPGKVWWLPHVATRTSRKQADMFQKVYYEWFGENSKRTRFHTEEEWRAFYDELKASEHEERVGR